MVLRATTDYSIRIMVILAMRGRMTSSAEITDQMRISQKRLMRIAALLREGNLIVSRHGVNGGYALARSAKGITMWDILHCMDPSLCIMEQPECFADTGKNTLNDMSAQRMFRTINEGFQAYLECVTLEQFASGRWHSAASAIVQNAQNEGRTLHPYPHSWEESQRAVDDKARQN